MGRTQLNILIELRFFLPTWLETTAKYTTSWITPCPFWTDSFCNFWICGFAFESWFWWCWDGPFEALLWAVLGNNPWESAWANLNVSEKFLPEKTKFYLSPKVPKSLAELNLSIFWDSIISHICCLMSHTSSILFEWTP